ncbi:MAG: hypothetical protein H6R11_1662 [Proteobacteria bacterium]|nr:hypothetical protein [Pseudomonadota bacterium]
MLLQQLGAAGDVEHRRQLTLAVEDRGGGAGEVDVSCEEMLVAMDDDRAFLHEAGTHAIGTLLLFAPHGAVAQAVAGGILDKVGIADDVEYDAFGIGEQHQSLGIGKLLVEVRHLQFGAGENLGHPLSPLLEFLVPNLIRFDLVTRVESEFVYAPDPRPRHHVLRFPRSLGHDRMD